MELFTPRLHLRELIEADADLANVYESDPDTMRYLPHPVRTLEESRAHVAKAIASAAETPRTVFDFGVVIRETGRYIGRAGFRYTAGEREAAAIWYILDPASRGHGYAVEAVRRVLAFAFEDLGIRRAYADIDPRNTASKKVAARAGMRFEGEFVEDVFMKGEWCGTTIYALLKREWP